MDESKGFDVGVDQAFVNQVAYCRKNGAPITARVVEVVRVLLHEADGQPFLSRVRNWEGAPLADALPLRCAGALHALHLSGAAPELGPIYGDDAVDEAGIVRAVIARHGDAMLPWLDGPPQTNEAGRSSVLVAGMLWLVRQGLPDRFDVLEIGSSAGINLMLYRYRWDLGGVEVGAPEPVMAFRPEWRGPPPPAGPFAFASLEGCDMAPLDLTDPTEAMRLRAYIWPEHAERFARLDAAIAAALKERPRLVEMSAADFVDARLQRPQAEGTTRVLMHSIVWQYLPDAEKRRIEAAMEKAGSEATQARALAWIALEADRTALGHTLRVRHWPGNGEPRQLATAHAHGAWVEWQAGA